MMEIGLPLEVIRQTARDLGGLSSSELEACLSSPAQASQAPPTPTGSPAAQPPPPPGAPPEAGIMGPPLCQRDRSEHCFAFPGWDAPVEAWQAAIFETLYEPARGQRQAWERHPVGFQPVRSPDGSRPLREVASDGGESDMFPPEMLSALEARLGDGLADMPPDLRIQGCRWDSASRKVSEGLYSAVMLLSCDEAVIGVRTATKLSNQDHRWTLQTIRQLELPGEPTQTDDGVVANIGGTLLRYEVYDAKGTIAGVMTPGTVVERTVMSTEQITATAAALVDQATARWLERAIQQRHLSGRDELVQYLVFTASQELDRASPDEAEIASLLATARFAGGPEAPGLQAQQARLRRLEATRQAARDERAAARAASGTSSTGSLNSDMEQRAEQTLQQNPETGWEPFQGMECRAVREMGDAWVSTYLLYRAQCRAQAALACESNLWCEARSSRDVICKKVHAVPGSPRESSACTEYLHEMVGDEASIPR